MKLRLFEFEDQSWLPNTIREGMTDYLRFILNSGNFYEPVAAKIVQLLEKTNATRVIDLCAGGGGTMEQMQKIIEIKYAPTVQFILTDIFPNINAYQFIQQKTNGKIGFVNIPVNAAEVPLSLDGVRTIFSAFHHFDMVTAKKVIEDVVEKRAAIGVFDGGDKNLFFIILMTLLHPVAFILFTPFLRPFKWSRLLLTYILPVIPFCTMWDGIVSIIRLYSPQQLLKIATSINDKDYCWQAGKLKNKYGMNITYLLGYPI